jgi:glycosyltransferase involved in cell wall biosynthesis
MRALWIHNFRESNPNAGCFMHTTAEALRRAGVDVQLVHLGDLRRPGSVHAARRLICQLADSFDLVHAQYGSACALAGLHCGKPLVVSIRGNDWNVHSETFHWLWLHTRLARWASSRALRSATAAVTVSHRIAHDISSSFGHLHVATIPSTIDLARWQPRPRFEREHRVGHRVLFTASNLRDPIKRYPLFCKVIAFAQRHLKNVTPVIANGVPHGEMPQLVASCDAVVCASESEGWPNSVKEALACDVPFVSTDVSDLSEIARIEPSCRVCGADPYSMGTALCEVLQAAPAENLRRHIAGMDMSTTAQQLIDLYRVVLTGGTCAA